MSRIWLVAFLFLTSGCRGLSARPFCHDPAELERAGIPCCVVVREHHGERIGEIDFTRFDAVTVRSDMPIEIRQHAVDWDDPAFRAYSWRPLSPTRLNFDAKYVIHGKGPTTVWHKGRCTFWTAATGEWFLVGHHIDALVAVHAFENCEIEGPLELHIARAADRDSADFVFLDHAVEGKQFTASIAPNTPGAAPTAITFRSDDEKEPEEVIVRLDDD